MKCDITEEQVASGVGGYSAGGRHNFQQEISLNKTSQHVRSSGTLRDPPTGSSIRRFPDKDLKQQRAEHQTLKPLNSLLNFGVKQIKSEIT